MKIFLIITALILLAVILFCAWFFLNEGNSAKYAVKNMRPDPDSPLKGKTLIFLGSSVTLGAASGKEAVADMIAFKDGANVIKEAVNGTTLVDSKSKLGGGDSYITRMKRLARDIPADALILQLSTNDASTGQPVGTIAEGFDMNTFDTSTVIGAMEYIIAYAKETWHCPVIIYSGPDFGSDTYRQMNEAVKQLQEKWGIGFIDLFDDQDINTKYCSRDYIADSFIRPIHPTKKGYQTWLPYFEKEISRILKTGVK